MGSLADPVSHPSSCRCLPSGRWQQELGCETGSARLPKDGPIHSTDSSKIIPSKKYGHPFMIPSMIFPPIILKTMSTIPFHNFLIFSCTMPIICKCM